PGSGTSALPRHGPGTRPFRWSLVQGEWSLVQGEWSLDQAGWSLDQAGWSLVIAGITSGLRHQGTQSR
ncbi:MAG: hypothetical protein ACREOE_11220, partial [Gemmatimonadales bacterium]